MNFFYFNEPEAGKNRGRGEGKNIEIVNLLRVLVKSSTAALIQGKQKQHITNKWQ